jgi:ATP-dependent Clp protease protease subunit
VPVIGRLDAERAAVVAAQLLLLDAKNGDPVTLRLDSPDADLTAVWTLTDTLDALVVDVNALVVGELGGGSLALLTAATGRQAHPHARFRLSDPVLGQIHGTASEVSGEAAANQQSLDAFRARLAELTGRDLDDIETDLRRGRFLTAPEAVEYGLVTALTERPVRR